ncbi:MAG: hypothetical protein AAF193_04290, partial [Bacteroidota bacterium]
VNMNEVVDPFTGVFLRGTFNGFCGDDCAPLSDDDMDGIWTITIPLAEGNYDYKFATENDGFEELTLDAPCTITSFGFTNRALQVQGVTVQPTVCFGSCDDCSPVPSGCTDSNANNYDPAAVQDNGSCLYDVSFSVDMSQYVGSFTTVYISGAFNGWNGTANPMDDSNMDNIWEVTVEMTTGDQEYKFTIDDWTDEEMFSGGESCTVTNGGFTNRVINVAGDTAAPLVCWNLCTACPSAFWNVTFRVDMATKRFLWTACTSLHLSKDLILLLLK